MSVITRSRLVKIPAVRAAVHNFRAWRGRRQLRHLTVEGTSATRVLAAITLALAGEPAAGELEWMDRIEQMRMELSQSTAVIEMTDFGSGTQAQLGTQDQTTTRTIGKMTLSSKPERWAYLLFRLVRELTPDSGLELGACVGISAAYQAAAMELNGKGRLLSLEGALALAERSTQTLTDLGLESRASVRLGRFTETLPGALDDLTQVDWAFIDGHHDEVATLRYAEQILERAPDQAVLVFDDINWSDGMRSAWAKVVADERFVLTVDLGSVGIAIVGAGPHRALKLSYA